MLEIVCPNSQPKKKKKKKKEVILTILCIAWILLIPSLNVYDLVFEFFFLNMLYHISLKKGLNYYIWYLFQSLSLLPIVIKLFYPNSFDEICFLCKLLISDSCILSWITASMPNSGLFYPLFPLSTMWKIGIFIVHFNLLLFLNYFPFFLQEIKDEQQSTQTSSKVKKKERIKPDSSIQNDQTAMPDT